MTYKDLLNELLQFTACELQQDVTIYPLELDEFCPVTSFRVSGADGSDCPADGILDKGHWFMEIDG